MKEKQDLRAAGEGCCHEVYLALSGPVVPLVEGCAGDAAGRELSGYLTQRCYLYLHGLLRALDEHLDVRLVRTLASTVTALVRQRNRPLGLLLSELGGYLAGPEHAPAGTKRLAKVLHSPKWRAEEAEDYPLLMGQCRVAAEAQRVPEGRALCILDGSVIEKPESAELVGQSPVRSSKARRLARSRPKQGPGYWRGRPGRPVVVPGFEWVGVLVTGWTGQAERRSLTLGAWHWYAKPPRAQTADGSPGTTAEVAGTAVATEGPAPAPRDPEIPCQRAAEAQREVLERVVGSWGADRLLHIWDRGLSGAGWLGEALDRGWHFVVRWKKGNHLRRPDAPSAGHPTAAPTPLPRQAVLGLSSRRPS